VLCKNLCSGVMCSVRICVQELCAVSDPDRQLTHDTCSAVAVQQRPLYFFTLTLRVFHLFNCSSTSRRMLEGGWGELYRRVHSVRALRAQ
jgi:hypothetical protein